jgi:hypothetical protein
VTAGVADGAAPRFDGRQDVVEVVAEDGEGPDDVTPLSRRTRRARADAAPAVI